jgi:hypothetical protein
VEYYEAFSDLVGVVLEESRVLEVAPATAGLALRLYAVLTRDHPLYAEPVPGELYCYRTGWLTVSSREPVEIRLSGAAPAIDATATPDYGHVDAFGQNSEDDWELEGDWGYARVHDARVSLDLE